MKKIYLASALALAVVAPAKADDISDKIAQQLGQCFIANAQILGQAQSLAKELNALKEVSKQLKEKCGLPCKDIALEQTPVPNKVQTESVAPPAVQDQPK